MTKRTYRGSGRGGMISLRCNMSVLGLIGQYLGEENMLELRSSCFGHLFHFPELQFQGQLFNVLLRKLDKSSLRRDCLDFDVQGRRLQFTPRDFAMLTGLKFSGWSDPPIESEIHREIFRQKSAITLGDVVQAFKSECTKSGGSSAMCLRLAFLVILYSILLVAGGKANNVDLTYLHLVDDLDRFKSFPWGRVAYSNLVMRTHQARRILDNLDRHGKKLAFDASGFVLALQVWVYEVIPIVSRNCAVRIGEAVDQLPRMLRWSASMSIKFDLVNRYFLKAPIDELRPMTILSEGEVQFLTNLGIDATIDCSVGRQKDGIESRRNHVPYISTGSCTSGVSTPHTPDKPNAVQMLEMRVLELERVISYMKSASCKSVKHDTERGDADSDQNRTIVDEKTCVGPELVAPHNVTVPMAVSGEKDCLTYTSPVGKCETWSDVPTKEGKSLCEGPPNSKEVRKRKAKSIPPARRPATRSTTHLSYPTAGNPSPLKLSKFDPTSAGCSPSLLEAFKLWRKKAKREGPRLFLSLPFAMVHDVDGPWFDDMWKSRGWLNTDHINALIDMLLITSRREPGRFLEGWTAMEMICWDALCKENYENVQERVSPYVQGVFPRDGPLHWGLASKVYGIGHVKGNHWVCFEVSLADRLVTVFDSMSGTNSWKEVGVVFEIVCQNLSRLCDDHHIWEGNRGTSAVRRRWCAVPASVSPPQQYGTSDCGIMAMKFMECLVSGHEINLINPDRCGEFRHLYCAQIYGMRQVSFL